ncbi:endonuclease [Shewanella sp. Choline-02u-19]|uniref:extracellular exonuclease ExeM n=1 Tax=unclassified Shewanella TaxID=196818 RepID=UPI000C32C866|nr:MULTISPECIES: extracellular exonuclease ExeM [unclassified Shewanella]PKH55588.1 endonuclease [Shewanella sp. Bg11-22]PKI29938.1 endonuclease [Shewanella sp. Choline-02u-19]
MDNVKKLSVLALSIAAALPMMASADVIISEYVEGSGGNKKAIELYNAGDTAVDLSGYTLIRHGNGAAAASLMATLSGTLAANGTKVVVHNLTDIPLDAGIDQLTSTKMTFNGNDAVDLMNGTTVIDRVGILSSDNFAKDVTLQRSDAVTAPQAVWVESEWIDKGTNYLAGLGARSGDFVGGAGPGPEPEVPAFSCTGATFTPIYDVQGTGFKSPLIADGKYKTDADYTVIGVVTARADSQKGFYLQEIDGDGSLFTSDGIFVNTNGSADEAIQPGVKVCVQGKIEESYGLTRITDVGDNFATDGNAEVPAAEPLYIVEGERLSNTLERLEGMKVKLDLATDMKVTSMYGRSGDPLGLVLSHKAPLMKATQVEAPGSDAAAAIQSKNKANQLQIIPSIKAPNGTVPYLADFNAETGYIRIGDTITNLEGMIGYGYGKYHLVATNQIATSDILRSDNDRSSTPDIATMGDIRVASFNVLNLFTSDSDVGGTLNATCKDQADADKAKKSCGRGAHTLEDYLKQRTKIVSALKEMNADVVGLMEIENNGFGETSSIQYLVNALNAELPAIDAYKFIEANEADKYKGKFIGSDAITVGLLYRPSKVKPAGDAFVIETPEQHAPAGVMSRGEGNDAETSPSYNKYQRHSLAQTFQINDEKLTVLVNHLKSKGSSCLEDWAEFAEKNDPADLQGHCNEFRVSAAKVIGESLKDIEGDILVLGDMNAYGMEDPIAVLTDYDAATAEREIVSASWTTLEGKVYEQTGSKIDKGYGLINLNTQAHGASTYSYSYSGELGNLDHALANASAAARLVDIQDWHINSVESILFQYSAYNQGDIEISDNAFRSSDHDPVIIALSYPAPVEPVVPVVPPKKDDGGSLGYLSLLMLSLFGLRRRKH